MKNILVAIDATRLDMTTIEFACYLAKLTNAKITGAFLENLIADRKPLLKNIQGKAYVEWDIDESSPKMIEKRKEIENNIRLFKEKCNNKGVTCIVHREKGIPAAEMVAESRFADIVVTDIATSFKKVFEGSPTHFVKDLLKDSECPVVIAPEHFDGIDGIVFTYDGSRSATFAIRQFTYLFPELYEKPVSVFHVNEKSELTPEQKQRIGGWLQNYYSIVGFEAKGGDATYEMLAYLCLKKNIFIVMGAYGRSAVSRFFKHSRADVIAKYISQPIFITHY